MNTLNTKRPVISLRHIRTLSPRAIAVVERHQAAFAGIACVGQKVIPAAEEYNHLYDSSVKLRNVAASALARSHDSVAELRKEIRQGVVVATTHAPSFDARDVESSAATPEGLISAGTKLLEVLTAVEAVDPSVAPIAASVRAALKNAERDVTASLAARDELQWAQAEVRGSAVILNGHLCSLRRVLRTVIGRRSVYYQALRVSRRASEAAEDVDPIVEGTTAAAVAPLVVPGVAPASTNGVANGAHAGNGSPSA